jgi:hypothetical protein
MNMWDHLGYSHWAQRKSVAEGEKAPCNELQDESHGVVTTSIQHITITDFQ